MENASKQQAREECATVDKIGAVSVEESSK